MKKHLVEEILQLMDNRRNKNKQSQTEYKITHSEIIHKRKTAKEVWLNSKCKELKE